MKSNIKLAMPDIGEAEIAAVSDVLLSGQLVQSTQVLAFESDISCLTGSKFVVAVSSGTAALHLAMIALEIGQGDLVFVPSFAWPSAANVAMLVGAVPIFVDVILSTGNIDPLHVRTRIEESMAKNYGRPKGIVAIHEFGLPCELDAISAIANEFGLLLIEDAACALGSIYNGEAVGTIGKLGMFSFHPRKSITTGEGGALVTSDSALADSLMALRNHGQQPGGKYQFHIPGLNYRLTEMQGAIGHIQMGKLNHLLNRRKEIAGWYFEQLAEVDQINLPECNESHTWQTFMIRLGESIERTKIINYLDSQGIETGPAAIAAHSQPVFASLPGRCDMPVSTNLAEQGLALPMHSQITEANVGKIASELRTAIQANPVESVSCNS